MTKLDELEKLEQEATPGPWVKGRDDMTTYLPHPGDPDSGDVWACKYVYSEREYNQDFVVFSEDPHRDGKFIAAIRNSAKDLIAVARAVKELRKQHMACGTWYWNVGCEYAEAVDKALSKLEEK